ncbi:MAG TPA: thiamine-phosphate kinase [Candidatus Glassbacteria bacterium]|nr:thiamine-phosphate kinase [Candidatus Glassbacteria bacterium]
MGEFEAIERIRRLAERRKQGGRIALGIGDDCCLIEGDSGELFAVSTDSSVENVHFRLDYFTLRQAGYRAVVTAISDLAAMAAEPVCLVAAASVSAASGEAAVSELAEGLVEAAERYLCPLTGGDLTSSPGPLFICVTVIGRCERGQAITRSGATPGDEIWVSGTPGDAAAVLAVAERVRAGAADPLPELSLEYRDRLIAPEARVAEALELMQAARPTAMIDVSDGVAADLGHILEASGCGAELDQWLLPVSDYSRTIAADQGYEPEHFFLRGGEDYELLFSVPAGALDKSLASLYEKTGTDFTKIGRITDRSGELLLVSASGEKIKIEKTGFNHFA